MDIKQLKQLLALVSDNDIAEFEFEKDGVKVKVKKRVDVHSDAPAMTSPPGVRSGSRVVQEDEGANSDEQKELAGTSVVTSPMVGTFYLQPQPEADPFVKVGDRINKGQVLCIIEAMKLLNEIESEFAGELVEIFVGNSQPVQFGDRLFSIKENG